MNHSADGGLVKWAQDTVVLGKFSDKGQLIEGLARLKLSHR